jgi:hypothetical protein
LNSSLYLAMVVPLRVLELTILHSEPPDNYANT